MPVRILLVDDDREFREELKAYLDDYECVEAATGAEALAAIRKAHAIDIVILDVRMPDMQGTDVLREMKRIDPGLGIIMLTGYGSKDVVVEALKARADDFVEKSADVVRIKGIVERLLDAQGSAGSHGAGEAGKVELAKRFLRRNCYKRVTLADAAQAVSLSPKYLSRIFAKEAGGFVRFRQRVKVAESKRLLSSSSLNIGQIAERLGYRNPETFIRVFKKMTGVSPSRFRGARPRRAGRRGKKR